MTRHILCTLVVLGFAFEGYGQNLRDTTNHADYVVIAPTSYIPVAEELSAFRRSKNGFSTIVVNVDSIMAQFQISVSPDTALRDFILYTMNHWQDPHPQYFVLAGNTNVIPSHSEVETLYQQGNIDTVIVRDQWFVETLGTDNLVHTVTCLGRFPAWDSTSLAIMVDKTIQYETDSFHSWNNRAIALADYWPEDGNIFEYDSKNLQSYLDSLWTDTISVHIRGDSPNHLDSTAFMNLWNQGAAVVSYAGHADDIQFSHYRYFTTWSIDSLTNGDRLPVCLFGGCDLNFNTGPTLSIPTHLLEKTNGGAVAVIASDGQMYEQSTQTFYSTLLQEMIRNPDAPLGKAYEEAMPGWTFDYSDRFTFLGDPALIVKHSARSTAIASTVVHRSSFTLEQNYPNPFNPTTVIGYTVPTYGSVTLRVYDILGREVKTLVNERQSAGSHSVVFNAGQLPSGVYFYRIQSGDFVQTKKMVLVK